MRLGQTRQVGAANRVSYANSNSVDTAVGQRSSGGNHVVLRLAEDTQSPVERERFCPDGFQTGNRLGNFDCGGRICSWLAIVIGLYAELAAALFGFQMLVGTFWKLKIKKPFTDYSSDIQWSVR